jgi:hypothetical protein
LGKTKFFILRKENHPGKSRKLPGDTELIQPAPLGNTTSTVAPLVEKFDHIHTRSNTILEGEIVGVEATELVYIPMGQQIQRTISRKEVQKIVYKDGRTENFDSLDTNFTSATQETTPLRKERVRSRPGKYLGLLAGGTASNFYRTQFFPFPNKSHLDWEAGLVGSPLATRFYQARLEMLYANKGAVETFQSSNLTVQSESRLTYLQANVLPLILKTGSNRLNFALGAGGYFSYLLRASSRSDLSMGDMEEDPLARQQFDVSTDYGLMALTGLYVRHKPLVEVRYTHGLGQLMSNSPIRVQGIHVSLFLIF